MSEDEGRWTPYEDLDGNRRLMVDDSDWKVRAMAAERGYGVDKLVKDVDPCVREAVAHLGYGHSILMHDPEFEVREAVASCCSDPALLAGDPAWQVRRMVARRGSELDPGVLEALLGDGHDEVRMAALDSLEAHSTRPPAPAGMAPASPGRDRVPGHAGEAGPSRHRPKARGV